MVSSVGVGKLEVCQTLPLLTPQCTRTWWWASPVVPGHCSSGGDGRAMSHVSTPLWKGLLRRSQGESTPASANLKDTGRKESKIRVRFQRVYNMFNVYLPCLCQALVKRDVPLSWHVKDVLVVTWMKLVRGAGQMLAKFNIGFVFLLKVYCVLTMSL